MRTSRKTDFRSRDVAKNNFSGIDIHCLPRPKPGASLSVPLFSLDVTDACSLSSSPPKKNSGQFSISKKTSTVTYNWTPVMAGMSQLDKIHFPNLQSAK